MFVSKKIAAGTKIKEVSKIFSKTKILVSSNHKKLLILFFIFVKYQNIEIN